MAGLDCRDAVLLHALSNAVYHLPRDGVVVRLTCESRVHVDRARTSLALCRWIAAHEGPALSPAVVAQPVIAASTVATIWPYRPPSKHPDPAALAEALRELHAIPAGPPLPAFRPLARLRDALSLDDSRPDPVLDPDERRWLVAHCERLCAAYDTVVSQLGAGPVHGDAHLDNLLYDETVKRWVLIDFDRASDGPRELDLLYAAPDHFHEPPAARAAFTRAYGHDLLGWAGWSTLRDNSEAHSLASYIRRAPSSAAAAAELARRLGSLRDGDPDIRWVSVD